MTSNLIPSGKPSIFASISKPTDLQAIVRPTNPPPGISGFLFDIVGDESSELSSDITDHFAEDNTSLQDNIALRPERVTLRGIVAELSSGTPPADTVSDSGDPLPLNPALVPEETPGAEQAEAQAAEAEEGQSAAVVSSDSLFGFYENRSTQQANQTKQSWVFGFFYQLWSGRQLVTVETPYGVWDNMAIEAVRADQPEDSRSTSEFTLVLKKMRFAQSVTVNVGQLAGRALAQRSPVAQNGNANATNVTPAQRQSFFRMINPQAFNTNPR